jgi:hypothetical protein
MLGMGGLTYLTILIAGVNFAVVTVPRSAVGTLTAAPLGPLVKWTRGCFSVKWRRTLFFNCGTVPATRLVFLDWSVQGMVVRQVVVSGSGGPYLWRAVTRESPSFREKLH